MAQPKIGNLAPDFKATATNIETFKLSDFRGQNVVLYFYPKDNTPGCTTEGIEFNKSLKKFEKQNTIILGVSRDTMASHEKFCDKYGFNFPLITDENEAICKKYDVIKEKNMYGKKVMGIERSTFLIDENGKLIKEWRKVKVDNHVQDVLKAITDMNN